MTPAELRDILLHREVTAENGFLLLKEIGRYVSIEPEAPSTQDLVILALDRRGEFGHGFESLVDALASRMGLYPYLSPEDLPVSDLIAYEFNRPLNLDQFDIVFHRVQSQVYRYLLQGESVILSAPTSFGKSLIIDAIIASRRYANIAILVPTIALIDETRRRLSRFRDAYHIVTHTSQHIGDKNVFILTQERVLEYQDLPSIDFFVIDEFYKLGMEQDENRASLLNLAFYRLLKTSKAFYMLGPNVQALQGSAQGRIDARWVQTDYRTVATEVIDIPNSKRNIEGLVELCESLDEPSMIYCKSPNSVRQVGSALAEAFGPTNDPEALASAGWLISHYPPEWSYVKCLQHGIGLHHGRIPRALLQMSVRLFNEGHVKFLVCTSTLIEGVNTSAKNVIVYDKRLGTRNYDYFTYCNIRGRAGRMQRHFVGRVYNFIDPPQQELPIVDIPILSQPDDLPLQVVVEMDVDDRTQGSQDRVRGLEAQQFLPLTTIKANVGVDPEAQVALAQSLRDWPGARLQQFAWSGFPTSAQVRQLCLVVWAAFFQGSGRVSGVASGSQLATKLNKARAFGFDGWLTRDLADGIDADTAVEDILEFFRQWCGFNFPRYASAVQSIIRHEQERRGLPQGNFNTFIGQAKAAFMPPIISVLDEYGIPIQISSKLHADQPLPDDLDEALGRARADAAREGYLPEFERNFILTALGDA